MLRSLGLVLLLPLGLTACQSIAPSTLSAVETRELRVTSLEVRTPETAPIAWSSAEDDYLRANGLSQTDPALARTPEARGYLRDRASGRLKAAIERVVAARPAGSRPVRLVATVRRVDIPSAVQRVVVGGQPTVEADVEIYDARSNALLTTYKGGSGSNYAGQGIGGVLVDAALTSGGVTDDHYDRAANDYAGGFGRWLAAPESKAL